MSDTFDAGTDDNAGLDDLSAEYEAAREAEHELQTGHEDGADEPPEQDPIVDDAEKLKANLKERAGAARRERQARIAAEERATALEERLAALEGKKGDDPFAALREDDADPIGDLDAIKRILRGEAESRTKTQAEQQAAQQQQRNVQALASWAAEHEADIRLEKPDYDKAAEFVRESRLKELEAIHGSPAAAQQELQKELLGVVAKCRAENRDPAQVIYTLAETRGYKNTVAIDNAADKLATVKRGQAASRTLTGGKADSSELTIEAINRMPSDQRYAAYQKLRSMEMAREARG